MKLSELLKKNDADFVSVIINGITFSHVKKFKFNGDIEVKKGEKYIISKKGKQTEKVV